MRTSGTEEYGKSKQPLTDILSEMGELGREILAKKDSKLEREEKSKLEGEIIRESIMERSNKRTSQSPSSLDESESGVEGCTARKRRRVTQSQALKFGRLCFNLRRLEKSWSRRT